jgi:GINS complex protein
MGSGSELLEPSFMNIFVEMEMERIKFYLRSYLEIRLEKIERFAHHLSFSSSSALDGLLSAAEHHYLQG